MKLQRAFALLALLPALGLASCSGTPSAATVPPQPTASESPTPSATLTPSATPTSTPTPEAPSPEPTPEPTPEFDDGGRCALVTHGAYADQTGGKSRIYLVTAPDYGVSDATLVSCELRADGTYGESWATAANIGRNGFNTPEETWTYNFEDHKTPTGLFDFAWAFGLEDPGTALAYQTLNPSSKWSGNTSWNYNQYYEADSLTSDYDEDMWLYAQNGSYRQGVVLDYNISEPDPNLDFAIFLHTKRLPTAGCISLDEDDLLSVMWETPTDAAILMGVEYELAG